MVKLVCFLSTQAIYPLVSLAEDALWSMEDGVPSLSSSPSRVDRGNRSLGTPKPIPRSMAMSFCLISSILRVFFGSALDAERKTEVEGSV
ncbi:hypothetical protein HD554DRAFT_2145171 [Boletus coccyginus]|nr:hypothetical protein HD554DRAFT_2145171 [Boletus coccyginus]